MTGYNGFSTTVVFVTIIDRGSHSRNLRSRMSAGGSAAMTRPAARRIVVASNGRAFIGSDSWRGRPMRSLGGGSQSQRVVCRTRRVYEIDGPARLKGRDSEFASAFSFIACWRSRTPLISLTQTPVRNPFRLTPNSRGDQMYGPTLTRRLRLDLEHLETRDTPAGTVNAVLSGTTLTLIGDDADNAVQLNKTPGGIEVVGINATQVTGGVQPFAGVIAIRAVMKDGNDTVFL